jgi:2-oxoacid:acceptor oxidoreductase gamma subunit (pyruvate/2-ketoisovalerate family)
MGATNPVTSPTAATPPIAGLRLPLEIRVHGRGGQGGVTFAKLIATIYAELGLHVQTFGDYGAERTGAPIRAFTRVDVGVVTSRNKVYHPHHLVVLDPGLLGPDVMDGAAPGGVLLLNTVRAPGDFEPAYGRFRFGTVDATAVARRHGIGTSALVIINTTLAGAYARMLGLPWDAVERAYRHQGLERDLGAAREAHDAVRIREVVPGAEAALPPAVSRPAPAVRPITEPLLDIPTPLRTGAWRTQVPAYLAHPAPCNAACPAGNDVVGFVQALARDGVDAAARVLLETQPLPSVCGRVCPAPCMSSCNRGTYDGAVNIRALERWIGDHATIPAPPPARATPARRVAVVGSGPAGLSAAWTLARRGHEVTLVEREAALGGVLRTGIPDYRLPPEVLDRDLDRLRALGIREVPGARLDAAGVERLAAANDAVILATGLATLGGLDVPGADLPGVTQGIPFLDAVKSGSAPRLAGHVVVVGGGNTAIDCARTALRHGAERVTIAYRRGRAEMPAIAGEIEEAAAEGVALRTLRAPVRVHGTGSVEAIELAEVELGAPDAGGRRRPVVTGRTSRLACDAVILAIGQSADLSLLPSGWTVADGRARSGGEPLRVWLAGDVATGDGTVTHAIGNGRRVAERVRAVLDGAPEPSPRPTPPEDVVTPAHVRFSHFEVDPPRRERHRDASERRRDFAEVNLGLDGPAEAGRCFSCGSCTRCDTCLLYCPEGVIARAGDGYRVDHDHCKGCGVCVAECPRRAMEMTPEAAVR